MKFRLKADMVFEADDIDDAFIQLTRQFLNFYIDGELKVEPEDEAAQLKRLKDELDDSKASYDAFVDQTKKDIRNICNQAVIGIFAPEFQLAGEIEVRGVGKTEPERPPPPKGLTELEALPAVGRYLGKLDPHDVRSRFKDGLSRTWEVVWVDGAWMKSRVIVLGGI